MVWACCGTIPLFFFHALVLGALIPASLALFYTAGIVATNVERRRGASPRWGIVWAQGLSAVVMGRTVLGAGFLFPVL